MTRRATFKNSPVPPCGTPPGCAQPPSLTSLPSVNPFLHFSPDFPHFPDNDFKFPLPLTSLPFAASRAGAFALKLLPPEPQNSVSFQAFPFSSCFAVLAVLAFKDLQTFGHSNIFEMQPSKTHAIHTFRFVPLCSAKFFLRFVASCSRSNPRRPSHPRSTRFCRANLILVC